MGKVKPSKDYLFVGIQLLLFIAYTFNFSVLKFPINAYLQISSIVVLSAGILLGVLAVLQLNKNLSPFPTPKVGGYLVTNGAFALSRHPIYTAIILTGLGYGLYQESLFKMVITVSLWILFYFKSSYEEHLLTSKFPEYSDYQAKVGRFFPKLFK